MERVVMVGVAGWEVAVVEVAVGVEEVVVEEVVVAEMVVVEEVALLNQNITLNQSANMMINLEED